MSEIAGVDAALRQLLDREIWIVTAAAGDERGGLTATWVSPVSIDSARPMLLAGLAPNHWTAQLAVRSRAFAVHLLRPDQAELAYRFAATSGANPDKFEALPLSLAASGTPLLDDCLAWFDCRVFAHFDAGDRWFLWADVVSSKTLASGQPLREQAFFGQLTSEQKQALKAGLGDDVELQRPLHAAWRESMQGGMPLAPLNLR